MTPFLQRFFSLLVVFYLFLNNSFATLAITTTPTATPIKIEKIDKKGVEQMLGRKLSFKEKLVLPLIIKKIKKGKTAPQAAEEAQTDGMAIASFACATAGFFVFSIIGSILAIIFGIIALNRIKKDPTKKGQGLAMAGLILGILGIVATILAVAYIIAFLASF